MAKIAIVKTGGKQYLVRENQELIVDKLSGKENDSVELETLAIFDDEKGLLEMGTPVLKTSLKATFIEDIKADKIRVARFKAKVRYRKVRGHRAQLTKLKVGAI